MNTTHFRLAPSPVVSEAERNAIEQRIAEIAGAADQRISGVSTLAPKSSSNHTTRFRLEPTERDPAVEQRIAEIADAVERRINA